MESEERLKLLAIKVKKMRKSGRVKIWQIEIRQEVKELREIFGTVKVCECTGLSQTTFHYWQEIFSKKGDSPKSHSGRKNTYNKNRLLA